MNKSANLSLLGVFFAIGALGMPFILGALEKKYSFETIVACVGYVALLGTIVFLMTRFPVANQSHGVPLSRFLGLLTDSFLLLIGFFLFCQSSFEAIINNWATTYLLSKIPVTMSEALYTLSLYVTGMAVMRIVLGKLLRKVKSGPVLLFSIALLAIGGLILQLSTTLVFSTVAMVIIGAGLAAGYPVTLAFVGERYASVSGTAFSIVISIGLVGSMIINYTMGFIAERYGIEHMVTMVFVLTAGMLCLSLVILKRVRN